MPGAKFVGFSKFLGALCFFLALLLLLMALTGKGPFHRVGQTLQVDRLRALLTVAPILQLLDPRGTNHSLSGCLGCWGRGGNFATDLLGACSLGPVFSSSFCSHLSGISEGLVLLFNNLPPHKTFRGPQPTQCVASWMRGEYGEAPNAWWIRRVTASRNVYESRHVRFLIRN